VKILESFITQLLIVGLLQCTTSTQENVNGAVANGKVTARFDARFTWWMLNIANCCRPSNDGNNATHWSRELAGFTNDVI